MGVVRDIEIKLSKPDSEFESSLMKFIDRVASRDIDVHKNPEGTIYEIYFGRGCYNRFVSFLLRCCSAFFESNDVLITFDADGDEYDERFVIKTVSGRIEVEFLEKVSPC